MCVPVCFRTSSAQQTQRAPRAACALASSHARMRRALMGALLLWLSAPSFTFPHSSFFFILLLSRHPCRVRSMNQRRRGRRHGGSLGATRSFRWVSRNIQTLFFTFRASHCTPACSCVVVSVSVSVPVHMHVHVHVPVTVAVAVALGVCPCMCVFVYLYGCRPRPSHLQRLCLPS